MYRLLDFLEVCGKSIVMVILFIVWLLVIDFIIIYFI